jgi:uncharacterized protein (UPF0332 family)
MQSRYLPHAGLALARRAIDDDPTGAISAAYYSTLYATRAALSERDIYAKTHSETWHRFREEFVQSGLVDGELVSLAQDAQGQREEADCEAWPAPRDEAEQMVELATRFLEAVAKLVQ